MPKLNLKMIAIAPWPESMYLDMNTYCLNLIELA